MQLAQVLLSNVNPVPTVEAAFPQDEAVKPERTRPAVIQTDALPGENVIKTSQIPAFEGTDKENIYRWLDRVTYVAVIPGGRRSSVTRSYESINRLQRSGFSV